MPKNTRFRACPARTAGTQVFKFAFKYYFGDSDINDCVNSHYLRSPLTAACQSLATAGPLLCRPASPTRPGSESAARPAAAALPCERHAGDRVDSESQIDSEPPEFEPGPSDSDPGHGPGDTTRARGPTRGSPAVTVTAL